MTTTELVLVMVSLNLLGLALVYVLYKRDQKRLSKMTEEQRRKEWEDSQW